MSDQVMVEYYRHHNHETSTKSRVALPLSPNERNWMKPMVSSSHDWKYIKNELRPSEEALQVEAETKSVPPSFLITYNDARATIYRKQIKEFTRGDSVVTSVEGWMKEIQANGGKGWFANEIGVNDPQSYLIAW
ncbi:hypothetical protein BX616_007337, partial [Lobosporangium transversale]